ncbi:MAG: hypothetical protein Q8L27_02665 [archaeon]|nr:hypothetical protein [archaeon]
MALYNSKGQIQYLDLNELNQILFTYEKIRDRMTIIHSSRGISARQRIDAARYLIEEGISEARKLPEEIKFLNNATIFLHDNSLNELERKCRGILRGKK